MVYFLYIKYYLLIMNCKKSEFLFIIFILLSLNISQVVAQDNEDVDYLTLYSSFLNLDFSNSPVVHIQNILLDSITKISSTEVDENTSIYWSKAYFKVYVDLSTGLTTPYSGVDVQVGTAEFIATHITPTPYLAILGTLVVSDMHFDYSHYKYADYIGSLYTGYEGRMNIDASYICPDASVFDINVEEYEIISEAFEGNVIEIRATTSAYEEQSYSYRIPDLRYTYDSLPDTGDDWNGLQDYIDDNNLGLSSSSLLDTTPTIQQGETLAPYGVFSALGDEQFTSPLVKIVPDVKELVRYMTSSSQWIVIDETNGLDRDAGVYTTLPITSANIGRVIGYDMTQNIIHQTLTVEVDLYSTLNIQIDEDYSAPSIDQIIQRFFENTKELLYIQAEDVNIVIGSSIIIGCLGIVSIFIFSSRFKKKRR